MQPNFTLKNYGHIYKILAAAMIFVLSFQTSFSQQARSSKNLTAEQASLRQAKLNRLRSAPVVSDNDAGLPNAVRPNPGPRTEAICATFTGSLAAGDLTMPARLFRPGVLGGSCTINYVHPGTSAVSPWYDTYTYTNNTGLTQCGTFTLTTTDLVNANIQHGIYNGSFDPSNTATNYLADPGSSTGTPQLAPLTFQKTINAGQTIVVVVWSANASGTPAGGASDYTVTIDFPICSSVPCSGTPAPGNTISSTPSACPGINFTLNPQNATTGAGVTYVWQSAPSSTGPWTNVTGGTNPSLTTNQTAATWYRVIVTCGANSGTSTPVQVGLTPVTGCYCTPTYTNGCALGDYIARVRLVTLDNASLCSTPPFTYYSAVPAPTLIAGATYPITVDVGPDTFGQNVGVWVDFNSDGDFSDPGEFIGQSGNVGANGIAVINIVVPTGATIGTTRLRIRGGDDVAMLATQSCGASNSTFGEAEDYNVNIAPCIQGVFTTQPSNVTVGCSGNTNITFVATGSALSFGWEYRTTPTGPWLTVPNSGVYSTTNTQSLTLSNVPSSLNGYQFRGLMSGPCTAVDFTNPVTLTVGPLVATVNPTAATICTGQIQALTLTNASFPTTTTFSSAALSLQIPDLNGPPASSAAVCNAGINNSINVPLAAGTVITRMDVKLNITHTYVGDLIIVLRAPNGQILNLDYHKSGTGTAGANFVNTVFSSAGVNSVGVTGTAPGYTGLWKADASIGAGSFGDLTGSGPTGFAPTTTSWNALWAGNVGGNWTIAICDPQEWAGDIGTLTSWSIDITYGAAAAGVWTSTPATPNTMFTNAGATVPYVAGSPANTIYVNPTATTTYSVIYSTTTPCVSAPTNVTVNVVNPVGTVTQPANRSACVGSNAVFTASALGGPNTYQWQVSTDGGVTYNNVTGGTASSLTVSGVTATMNNYRYRVVISAAPCAGSVTSNAAILTVNPLPTVTLTAPDLSITPGQSTTLTVGSSPAAAANGILWTLNGNAIAGTGSTQVVRVDGLGSYVARVTDVNGCVNTSAALNIGAEASDRLWLYPNPTPGVFQARLYYGGTITEKRVVSVFAANGQLVARKEFTFTNTSNPYMSMEFDLTKWGSGTYAVKVDNRHTGKVVSGLVVVHH